MTNPEEIKKQKPVRLLIRICLWTILLSISFWSYHQLSENYQKMELSNRMSEAILNDRANLIEKYVQELEATKENIRQMEVFVADLKNQVAAWKGKADVIPELEASIADLKQKNADLINDKTIIEAQLEKEKQKDLSYRLTKVETIKAGKELLAEHKASLQKIREKIIALKKEEMDAIRAAQEERDRIATLMGNNGFMMRHGKTCAVAENYPLEDTKDIKIQVEFVK